MPQLLSAAGTRLPTAPLLLRAPGVYRPQADTEVLRQVLADSGLARGADVLDLCTGTGAVAVAAAGLGARSTTAVDVSRRSVATARANARLHRAPVRVRRGDLYAPVAGERFDLVLSNPPYVPAHSGRLPRHRVERCWDGGLDGRLLVDRICAGAGAVLRPGGTLLLIHSDVTGEAATRGALAAAGLAAVVVARVRTAFGPVMRARAELMRARGLVGPAADTEHLLVFRADRG